MFNFLFWNTSKRFGFVPIISFNIGTCFGIVDITKHGSWTVCHAQTEIQRPLIKKFGPK